MKLKVLKLINDKWVEVSIPKEELKWILRDPIQKEFYKPIIEF